MTNSKHTYTVLITLFLGLSAQGCNNKFKLKGTKPLEGQVNNLNHNLVDLGNDVNGLNGNLAGLQGNLDNLGNDFDALNSSVENLNNSLSNPLPTAPVTPGLPELTFSIDIEDYNYTQSPVREVQNKSWQNMKYFTINASLNQDEVISGKRLTFSHYLPGVEIVRFRDWKVVGRAIQAGTIQDIAPIGTAIDVVTRGQSETYFVRADLSRVDRETLMTTQLTGITTQDGNIDLAVFNYIDEVLVEVGPKASISPVSSTNYSVDTTGDTWQTISRFRVNELGDTGISLNQGQFKIKVPAANNAQIRVMDENSVVVGTAYIDYYNPNQAEETIYWIEFNRTNVVKKLSGQNFTVQINTQTATLPAKFTTTLNWIWMKNPVNDTFAYATYNDMITSSVTVTVTE